MLKNLENIPSAMSDEVLYANEEMIVKYIYKLSVFPTYYENLVAQIFKNLASNESTHQYKLTSNSQRLLKEFQMRYCVVSRLHIAVEYSKKNKMFIRIIYTKKGSIRRRSN